MIVGVGTDIVMIDRIAKSWQRFGPRFAARILSADELIELPEKKNPVHFLAKRFAMKEAVAKALGTGMHQGVSWRQIGVTHDPQGKPVLALTGVALQRAEKLAVTDHHISTSDEKEYAIAFVVLEKSL